MPNALPVTILMTVPLPARIATQGFIVMQVAIPRHNISATKAIAQMQELQNAENATQVQYALAQAPLVAMLRNVPQVNIQPKAQPNVKIVPKAIIHTKAPQAVRKIQRKIVPLNQQPIINAHHVLPVSASQTVFAPLVKMENGRREVQRPVKIQHLYPIVQHILQRKTLV